MNDPETTMMPEGDELLQRLAPLLGWGDVRREESGLWGINPHVLELLPVPAYHLSLDQSLRIGGPLAHIRALGGQLRIRTSEASGDITDVWMVVWAYRGAIIQGAHANLATAIAQVYLAAANAGLLS